MPQLAKDIRSRQLHLPKGLCSIVASLFQHLQNQLCSDGWRIFEDVVEWILLCLMFDRSRKPRWSIINRLPSFKSIERTRTFWLGTLSYAVLNSLDNFSYLAERYVEDDLNGVFGVSEGSAHWQALRTWSSTPDSANLSVCSRSFQGLMISLASSGTVRFNP